MRGLTCAALERLDKHNAGGRPARCEALGSENARGGDGAASPKMASAQVHMRVVANDGNISTQQTCHGVVHRV